MNKLVKHNGLWCVKEKKRVRIQKKNQPSYSPSHFRPDRVTYQTLRPRVLAEWPSYFSSFNEFIKKSHENNKFLAYHT